MNPSLSLSLVETLAVAALGLVLGSLLVRFIPVLHRLCLPEPVLGGLALCAGFTIAQARGFSIQFDTSLQTPLMIAFFLSIGWMASLRNLKRGGPDVVKFLLLCSGVLVIQNLVGVGLAKLLGQNPLIGLLAGWSRWLEDRAPHSPLHQPSKRRDWPRPLRLALRAPSPES